MRYRDLSETPPPKRAPQAAAHRRGGMHRVKDQHRTNTHWDEKKHDELLYAIKAPERRHLYRKDMKKHEMAHALADYDRELYFKERREHKERVRLEKEKAKKLEQEKREKEKARQEKEREREQRRKRREEGDQGVSDSTVDEDAVGKGRRRDGLEPSRYGGEDVGQFLSDSESSETEEMMTPSSASSLYYQGKGPVKTLPKLRLYEWPDKELPDFDEGVEEGVEDIARNLKMPYAVMRMVTTESEEVVELPGGMYPDAVGPDFVPKLSDDVVTAVRNGTLIGTLRKAVVESGEEWAQRTLVQGETGSMFLILPPRSSDVPITEVWKKWKKFEDKARKERRSSLAKRGGQRGRGGIGGLRGIVKKGYTQQQAQERMQVKRQKMLEIFASAEYRPPICYLPAYLHHPKGFKNSQEYALENLYFIRFPGMDLPHYHFWTKDGEWEDPTKPNPAWAGIKTEDDERGILEAEQRAEALNEERTRLHKRVSFDESTLRRSTLDRTKMRVKKTTTPKKFTWSDKPPQTSKYRAALWQIERELCTDGLTVVLYRYRHKWLKEGKHEHWQYLIENMPKLYPSGKLPEAPPVHREDAEDLSKSLAEKFAAMEVPNMERPVEPIGGDEPWTRDDNAYWDIVDIAPNTFELDIQQELLRGLDSPAFSPRSTRSASALSRRSSGLMRRSSDLPRNFEQFHQWLADLNPSFNPLGLQAPDSPVEQTLRAFERQAWEHLFQKHTEEAAANAKEKRRLRKSSIAVSDGETVPNLISQIEAMPVAELKWQLYRLMDDKLKHDQYCRICLKLLEKSDLEGIYEHYQEHKEEAGERCPFCGMEWIDLDSEWKASHIFSHDVFDPGEWGSSNLRRRRSSNGSSIAKSRDLTALPRIRKRSSRLSSISTDVIIPQTRSRRSSKVTFSPKTVERRVAYNDQTDTGIDADVSSLGAISPKSALRRNSATRKKVTTTKKAILRPDPNTRLTRNKAKGKEKAPAKPKRNGTRNGQIPSPVLDPNYITPSTPSNRTESPPLALVHRYAAEHDLAAWAPRRHSTSGDEHISSPPLPRVHRYPAGHDLAAWDPRRHSTSGEEHITSPYLPRVVRYPVSHPNAAYNSRKLSKSSTDSLEYLRTRGRGTGKTAKIGKIVKTRKTTTKANARTQGKGKTKAGDQSHIYGPIAASTRPVPDPNLEGAGRRRNTEDLTYRGRPSSASSATSYELVQLKIPKAKKRTSESTLYQDAPTSLSLISESTTRSAKRKKLGRTVTVTSVAPSPKTNKVVAKQPTAKPQPKQADLLNILGSPEAGDAGLRNLSTISNAFSTGLDRRNRALRNPILEAIPSSLNSSRKRKASTASTASKTSTALKKSRRGKAPQGLERRFSKVLNTRMEPAHDNVPDAGEEDFMQFVDWDGRAYENDTEDVVTGNPFVPLSKGKAKAAAKPKSSSSFRPSELTGSHTDTEVDTEEDPGKRTLSGRRLVPPLTIAPAKRLSKPNPALWSMGSMVGTPAIETSNTINPRRPKDGAVSPKPVSPNPPTTTTTTTTTAPTKSATPQSVPGPACLTCRQRKAGCSKDGPPCQRCAKDGYMCEYEDDRKASRTTRPAKTACLNCRRRKKGCSKDGPPCEQCVAKDLYFCAYDFEDTAATKRAPNARKDSADLTAASTGRRHSTTSAKASVSRKSSTTSPSSGPSIRGRAALEPSHLSLSLKRHSYDVPSSDTRAIVPPNTPAATPFASSSSGRRRVRKPSVAYDPASELDPRKLSDRIGKVKTTRGGLVRELPVEIVRSAKGKARGRSVSVARGKAAKIVKIVEKDGVDAATEKREGEENPTVKTQAPRKARPPTTPRPRKRTIPTPSEAGSPLTSKAKTTRATGTRDSPKGKARAKAAVSKGRPKI